MGSDITLGASCDGSVPTAPLGVPSPAVLLRNPALTLLVVVAWPAEMKQEAPSCKTEEAALIISESPLVPLPPVLEE